MRTREILQTEIWSKETSRNIIRKTLVVLRFVGIGVGIVVVISFLFGLVWTHWLTAGERNAGKTALTQLDKLQSFEGASDAEFNRQEGIANEEVSAASKVKVTYRDFEVATYLELYLSCTEALRYYHKVLDKQDLQASYKKSERYKKLDLEIETSERNEIKNLRELLHKSLDK